MPNPLSQPPWCFCSYPRWFRSTSWAHLPSLLSEGNQERERRHLPLSLMVQPRRLLVRMMVLLLLAVLAQGLLLLLLLRAPSGFIH